MAANITGGFTLSGSASYQAAGGGISVPIDGITLGQNDFAVVNPQLAYGTGASLTSAGAIQINDWYSKLASIGATTTLTISLNGGADANPFGTALAFTALKFLVIAVMGADGAKVVRVGPQNVANSAQLWFGGTGAQAYEQVYFSTMKVGALAGWTITAATAMNFNIHNPGASAVSVAILLGGVR